MSKPLVQFRLSDDEIELLRSFSEDGESEGLTAKRLLLQALGVSTKSPAPTPLKLTEDLKTYINEEIEERTQYVIDSSNNLLKRLQKEIQQLTKKVEVLEKKPDVNPRKRRTAKSSELV